MKFYEIAIMSNSNDDEYRVLLLPTYMRILYLIMMKSHVLKNHFLVAMPRLVDFNFSKSVIYIYEHNNEGALGMIINKPLQINLGKVLEHLDIKLGESKVGNLPVLMGGPVGQEHGFIIFSQPSTQNGAEILVSASKDMLREIAVGKGPGDFIVTLGYSGWEAGQLEQEIAHNDWLIVPFNHDILFNTPIEKRWHATAALIGIDIHHLSNQVGHA
jgi:putative transcriptional regulator